MSSAGLSTAGAIPVRNPKGEISMQKVKVQRYVSGRRPNYADYSSDSSDSSEEELMTERIRKRKVELENAQPASEPIVFVSDEVVRSDRRLQRLQRRHDEDGTKMDIVTVPDEPQFMMGEHHAELGDRRRHRRVVESEDSDLEDGEDETVERRHAMLRMKRELEEEELLEMEDDRDSPEDEDDEELEEDEDEYEEYTDSEEEVGPRLKPVFVRKRDRVTILEKEKEDAKFRLVEQENKKAAEERRRQALKIIEDERKKELQDKKDEVTDEMIRMSIATLDTDDENEETGYEFWKLRELKRIKRTKDEREAVLKEKEEVERFHNMSEEQRLVELKNNPKIVTNAAPKGKYRFLQKYYHRGAFFLNEEENVLKRDVALPTLEDHFDKTVLPAVMQVKNFGRSGRTKYTHLVDQDTTAFDSPWVAESSQTSKFLNTQAGGMKQVFDRPTKKRK